MVGLTLPETNIAPEIDPWKRRFLLETIIFRCENVSFRECKTFLRMGIPTKSEETRKKVWTFFSERANSAGQETMGTQKYSALVWVGSSLLFWGGAVLTLAESSWEEKSLVA